MKLETVRRFALSLPRVEEAPHFHFGSFRVGGKILVTVPPEHTHIHVFVNEAARDPVLALYPAWAEKLLWGGKAIGVRIQLAKGRPAVVEQLIRQAWDQKAPAKVFKLFGPLSQ